MWRSKWMSKLLSVRSMEATQDHLSSHHHRMPTKRSSILSYMEPNNKRNPIRSEWRGYTLSTTLCNAIQKGLNFTRNVSVLRVSYEVSVELNVKECKYRFCGKQDETLIHLLSNYELLRNLRVSNQLIRVSVILIQWCSLRYHVLSQQTQYGIQCNPQYMIGRSFLQKISLFTWDADYIVLTWYFFIIYVSGLFSSKLQRFCKFLL